ncbi:alpha-L-rhamnosidase [Amphibacillus jilinensis]|uniref:alpha-L-rhamnosidase n=1 Tax=Amphibacillus jilinensis TaxID=1216008 RepID=UPI0003131C58|nr:alpha-L-rhamnosidase [Amphibacillus jilinensis]
MKITKLRTNHLENPLGFQLETVRLSWVIDRDRADYARKQESAQIEIAVDTTFQSIVYDSGRDQNISSVGHQVNLELEPRTRYYWRVHVWTDTNEYLMSDTAWFETAKMCEPWQASWITPSLDKNIQPYIRKSFTLPSDADISSARLYITGLGVYQFEINGVIDHSEYLAPGFHAYDHWIQYQTYDVTDLLSSGENGIGVMLGDGWYKGRFGFDGGYHDLYGDQLMLIAELIVTLANGEEIIIKSDQSWTCHTSPISFSGIYDGEVYDARKEISNWSKPSFDDTNWFEMKEIKADMSKLQARLSLPVKVMKMLKPIEVIDTPKGEIVLDFGQNMTGWVQVDVDLPAGTKLQLKHGEVLQNGNFYQGNLRTAKAEYHYISAGDKRVIQPHFTFYGFRYVKVEGIDKAIDPNDFTACVLYSEMNQTGYIETSDSKVNQLFSNALWGQKGNFLDVPTDCPQRDERMGWTGDAQIFASTACFNMYSPAFYHKFLTDLHEEQKSLNGSVPFIVPTIKPPNDPGFVTGHGSSAWGDAATIIPWTLYLHYGDRTLLAEHFPIMQGWVDYITEIDDQNGGDRLWREGFHFGDWLALDGTDPMGMMGGTDPYYIASAYYCYSAQLLVFAARALDKKELADHYQQLTDQIKQAIYREYFSVEGRSTIPTQTAYVVALYMNLIPENKKARVANDLKERILKEDVHLTTGFVGTPYLCAVLSEHGYNELAYTLLLNENYPSWLFAVNLGATTIWERWNSLKADGTISGTGMNSLNHYAYGSIVDWMYRYMCGINPVADGAGYQKFRIEPMPDIRLDYAKARFQSPKGMIESGWEILDDGMTLSFDLTIPFDSEADVILPNVDLQHMTINQTSINESDSTVVELADKVQLTLYAGHYTIVYPVTRSLKRRFNRDSTIRELLTTKQAREIFYQVLPQIANNEIARERNLETPICELLDQPIICQFISDVKLDELESALKQIN